MKRFLLFLFFLPLSSILATSASWTGTTNNNWNVNTNWNPNTAFPNAIDDAATFSLAIGVPTTITLGQDITIGTLTYSNTTSSAYTLSAGHNLILQGTQTGSPYIQVTGSTATPHVIQAPVILNGDLTVTISSTRALEISSQISGSNKLIKSGTGTGNLIFSGNSSNTYTAATLVNQGTLTLNKTGAQAILGDIQISGGTLSLSQGSQMSTSTNIQFTSGTFSMNGHSESIGSLTYQGGNFSLTGGETLTLNTTHATALTLYNTNLNVPTTIASPGGSGDIVFQAAGGGTAVISNNLNLGNFTRNFQIPKGNQAVDMRITGQLDGNGGMIKKGTGTLSIENTATLLGAVTVEAGALNVSSHLTAPSMLVGINAILEGTGTIQAPMTLQGTISPGNSIGTINLIGNQFFSKGSVTKIEINPTNGDLINITGNLTLENGATLALTMDTGTYPNNYRKNIVQTTTGVFGQFSLITSRFVIDYSDPNLIQVTYNPLIYSNLVQGGNPGIVANDLDLINPSLGSPLDEILYNAYIANPHEYRKFLNLLHPAQYKGLVLSQEKNSICFAKTLFNQISSQFISQAERDRFSHREREMVWVAGMGDFALQRNKGENVGYHTYTGGPILGWDWRCLDNFTAGLVAGTTFSHLDWRRDQGTGYIFSGYGGLYNLWYNDVTFIEDVIYGAYNFYRAKRIVDYDPIYKIAKFRTKGYEFGAELRHGYFINFLDAQLMPYIVVDYMYLRQKRISEKGADVLNLDVKGSNYSYCRAESGLALSGTYAIESHKISPSMKFGVFKDFRFQGAHYTSQFLGTTPKFRVKGLSRRHLEYSFGGGFNVVNDQLLGVSVQYEGEGTLKYWNHTINISFSADY